MTDLEPPSLEPTDHPRSALEADRAGRGVRSILWVVLGAALLAAVVYAIFF